MVDESRSPGEEALGIDRSDKSPRGDNAALEAVASLLSEQTGRKITPDKLVDAAGKWSQEASGKAKDPSVDDLHAKLGEQVLRIKKMNPNLEKMMIEAGRDPNDPEDVMAAVKALKASKKR